ncbi:xanthine dehydrogenase family protein molybdopterin-binding subunit [Rhodococcus sp. P1Y]|uniref:xanthine dehydrogenase family protein molybdopterin-binding subunit n=1 Tax=Rhodococcus sp. P1Y TaxID=1302308 RepID=UPI000EB46412|nr:xanthine dehydrogenase family protein molybdopterin-binding subunit [Rhodococcus sp. P1Y]AYJ48819.1 carbon monoxide dehydrogenase [Rhodococcus sp. P1Y]
MVKKPQPYPKTDAFSFVSGTSTYVDDVRLPNMLYMAVARSTMAHANLVAVDVADARRVAGVVRVLEGQEAATYLGPLPYSFGEPELIGGRRSVMTALPTEKVRFVGEAIAVVVGETRSAAAEGAAAITAVYEALPGVFDAAVFQKQRGAAGGLTRVLADRVIAKNVFECGDTHAALAAAVHTRNYRFSMQRSSTAPMEPRGYVASWSEGDGRLTVHASHQQPFQLRGQLSTVLGIDESAIRVVVPSVGGSFGLKMTGPVEEPLVCLMSLLTGRPVKWMESRGECFLGGGREQLHDVTVGFDQSGIVTVFDDKIVIPVGAESTSPGWRQAFVAAASFPTAYSIGNVAIESLVVETNEPPWQSLRGFGKEGPILVMERTMDLIARSLDLDPVVVRRRNLLSKDAFPHRMPSGYLIDSGDFAGVLDEVLSLADYDGLCDAVRTDTDTRILEGVGIAFEITPEGGGHASGRLAENVVPTIAADEAATISMDSDGHVHVYSGVTSPGGGGETSLAMLAADVLGLTRGDVTIVQGDTDIVPAGTGNASSRGTAVGGAAVVLAARDLATELTEHASALTGVPVSRIRLVDGHVELAEHPPLPFAAISAHALSLDPSALRHERTYRPVNTTRPDETAPYRYSYPYFSSGAYVAHVAVDTLTGKITLQGLTAVHDCGRVINEALVEGQLQGAMAMGVGIALFEHSQFDQGDPRSRSFKEYLIPRANDLPPFTVGHFETLSPNTLFGAKGAGEAGVGGALAAVANAVDHALARWGVEAKTFPLTPPRVLDMLDFNCDER